MENITEQFRAAIQQYALTPPQQIIADGKLHRFSSHGERGKKPGWYILYDGEIPAGAFGCWDCDTRQKWHTNIGRTLTAEEKKEHKKRLREAWQALEAETEKLYAEGQKKAQAIIDAAKPATGEHAYEKRKNLVACTGVMIGQWPQRNMPGGVLLIPLYDIEMVCWNIEAIFIAKHAGFERDKDFLCAARKKGLFFPIGNFENASVILIGEGYATMMSCHMATGLPAIVAFDAGNLYPVAEAIRKKYPNARLIITGDDDRWDPEKGNPGRKKAKEAGKQFGCQAIFPVFHDNDTKPTDFNDLHCLEGLEAVKAQLMRAAEHEHNQPASISDVTNVTAVTANDTATSCVTADVTAEEDGVTVAGKKPYVPSEDERPCYVIFEDWHEQEGRRYQPGVWYFSMTNPKARDAMPVPVSEWVCSPLYVEAITADGRDNNYGRLLRFRNSRGRWRHWGMPMELLRGSGEELRGELLSMGVEINQREKGAILVYLQAQHPERHVRSASQTGWCGAAFVLPDAVIGENASDVIFQSGERVQDEYACGGTLEDWRISIAAHAVGNPMLMMTISCAFAGPLLEPCNAESGGIHLTGDSSIGKTGLTAGGCSVWGDDKYKRSWRTTANGMEGVAALFNDCMLALDEISECDPKEVGAIVYSLGNGTGKQRASRTGSAREIRRWRCFVLSNGERSIETTMMEGGYRAKAGQSMRLANVPVLRHYGVWDELHGFENGAQLTDAIKTAAKLHYGHAGRAFLEKLTRDKRDFCTFLERIKALPEFTLKDGEGQEKRVAARFALIAMAGELATEYGITGWQEGAAIAAAVEGFKAWAVTRIKRGNCEKHDILERVSDFIERHGDSRFSNAEISADSSVRERAGWWRDDQNRRTYLFTAQGLKEALKGFDHNRALDALEEACVLPPAEANGERSKPQRIQGRSVRVYSIDAEKLGAFYGA